MDEVLHLHFQIGVRVQEARVEVLEEEEGALQVQFQVEVRVEPFLPQVQLHLSSPERLVCSFGDDDLRLLTGLGEDGELRGGALFATTGHIT